MNQQMRKITGGLPPDSDSSDDSDHDEEGRRAAPHSARENILPALMDILNEDNYDSTTLYHFNYLKYSSTLVVIKNCLYLEDKFLC